MSILFLPIYKSETGEQNNPAVNGLFSTSCDGQNKKFWEVLIHWDNVNSEWVEDTVFTPGQSIVALKVYNVCTGETSYIDYPFNNFRISQVCCVNESEDDDIFEEQFESQFE